MGEKIKQHTKWAGRGGVNVGVLGFDSVGQKYILRVEGGGVELRATRFESLEVNNESKI